MLPFPSCLRDLPLLPACFTFITHLHKYDKQVVIPDWLTFVCITRKYSAIYRPFSCWWQNYHIRCHDGCDQGIFWYQDTGWFTVAYHAYYALSSPSDQSVLGTSWRHHQTETFSALLALCEWNPPITPWIPLQRPVSFDVFFNLRLNKQLSKQGRRRWFETPSHSLWRHCNVVVCTRLKLLPWNSFVSGLHSTGVFQVLRLVLLAAFGAVD